MSIRRPPKTAARPIPICIVAEGFKEEIYLNRLKELNVWNSVYRGQIVNAKSQSNLAATYQNYYTSQLYHLVLVFCDTARWPYQQYREQKRQISLIHDGQLTTAEKVMVFANPCTLQIILSHFADGVELRTQNKTKNAPQIAKLTGVDDYDGHKDQIEEICRRIRRESYFEMRDRIACLSGRDDETPSTNFGVFREHLESADRGWIDEINRALDVE